MTVPARREAARLLLSLDPPAWSLRHACAVADVAAFLARRIAGRGTPINVRAVEAAALLHDVDKIPAGRVPGVRHGDGSAAWLEGHDMPELAPLVRDHPVTRLADEADFARLDAASLEAKVVAYAESLGWRVMSAHGNAWCYLYCPRADRSGCKVGVWSTAQKP